MPSPATLTKEYTYCWSVWRGWVYCKKEEQWDAGVEAYWEEKQNDPEVQQLLKRYEETNTFFKFFIRLFNIGNLGKIVSAKDYYQKLAQEEEHMQQPSPHFFQWLWQGFLNSLSSIGRLFHFSSRSALQVHPIQEDEEPFVHEPLKGSRNLSTDSQQKDCFKIFARDLEGGEFKGLLDGLKTLGLIEEKEEEFQRNGYVELSRTIYRARFIQLAFDHHPDRHSKKSKAEIQQASNQFVEIQKAYQKIEEILKNWQGREKWKEVVCEFSEDVSSQVKQYAKFWKMLAEYAEGIRELREGYDKIGARLECLETQIEFLEECKKQEAMMAAPHDEEDGRESIQGSEGSGVFYTNGFAHDRQLFSDEEVFADDEKYCGDVGSPVSPKDQNFSNQSVEVTAASTQENSRGSGHVGVYRELSQSREDGSRSGSSSPKAADRPKDGHRRTFSL